MITMPAYLHIGRLFLRLDMHVMNDKLVTDVGENYEYLRTIISNKIELLKIDAAEGAGRILGYLIVALIVLVLGLLIFLGLIISLAIFLSNLLGSPSLGLLITCLVLGIITFIIIRMRRKLFFEPIAYAFFKRQEPRTKL